MIRFSHSTTIARTPEQVFAYLVDPGKLGSWQRVDEITQLTPGREGVGTRFREVHRALGRRIIEITEIVVFEPGRRFDIRVVEGPPVDGRWDFEPEGEGGTRLTMTPTVRLPGVLRYARPVLELLTVLVFAGHHRRLRRVLEES